MGINIDDIKVEDVTHGRTRKYLKENTLDGNMFTRGFLYSFELVLAGRAKKPNVFLRYSDEWAREVLDDEDYEFWMSEKRKCLEGGAE